MTAEALETVFGRLPNLRGIPVHYFASVCVCFLEGHQQPQLHVPYRKEHRKSST
jgi:hypothetical protein